MAVIERDAERIGVSNTAVTFTGKGESERVVNIRNFEPLGARMSVRVIGRDGRWR